MGKIVKVSGPLVVATGMQDANMADVVRVGEQHLIGEILTMNGDSSRQFGLRGNLRHWPRRGSYFHPAHPCPWNWAPACWKIFMTAFSVPWRRS